jgi:hypothetical protein
MNCRYDDFGPVDIDAIMAEHRENIALADTRNSESTVSRTLRTVGLQECVGPISQNMVENAHVAHQYVRNDGCASHAQKVGGVTHSGGGRWVRYDTLGGKMNCEPRTLTIQ